MNTCECRERSVDQRDWCLGVEWWGEHMLGGRLHPALIVAMRWETVVGVGEGRET